MKHEISMLFLQNYWWCVLSLLTGVVVQMLYIFGGQVLSYQVGKTSMEREMTISVLGHKWGLTLASIATWVAVVWAVFPLMYAVTFSGAHAIWVLILLSYVVTICAYEFRNKSSFIEKGGNLYLYSTPGISFTNAGSAGGCFRYPLQNSCTDRVCNLCLRCG
jgi:cytochrome d ubiquinol oxidase subunit II